MEDEIFFSFKIQHDAEEMTLTDAEICTFQFKTSVSHR